MLSYMDDDPSTKLLPLSSRQLHQSRKWHASRHQHVFLDSPSLPCRALWRRKLRTSPTSPRRTHRPFPISTSWPCSQCLRMSATIRPKSRVSCPTSLTKDSAKRTQTEASCARRPLALTEGQLSRFAPCRRQGGLGKERNAHCTSCCGPAGVCGYGENFCGVGCTSNCDAVAMCGNFSEGGNTKCGMNLCCSWGK